MTKEKLEQYRARQKKISYLETKIMNLCSKEIPTVSGKVMASSKEFPYSPYRVGVLMEEPTEAARIEKRIAEWKKEIAVLIVETEEVEKFISEISDPEINLIFSYRYLDGMKLDEVAKQMNLDRSTVGKKISAFLKFPTIPILL